MVIFTLSYPSFSQEEQEKSPAAGVSAFAQQIFPNEFLFIEGTAEEGGHLNFFLQNFRIEAAGAGYTVTEDREDAAFTFKFDVSEHMIEDSAGVLHPAPLDDNQYIIRISLINNADGGEILYFDFYFTDLGEMYEYNRSLFQMATVYIPPDRREIFLPPDMKWQNKWLYLSASVEYPVSFYPLASKDLFGGQAAYMGPIGNPVSIQHLNNIILPQPGLALGLELHFSKVLSLGFNFRLNYGDPEDIFFLNMAAGGQFKFNIKTEDVLLQPYLAFSMPLTVSPMFEKYPNFAAGGGLQAGVRGGSSGSFFVDVNFMYSLGEVSIKNFLGDLAPNPSFINYNHFVFGVGVGYKFGMLNRQ